MELRPYQTDSIERLRAGLREGQRALVLSSPTGSGKTVIAMEMIHRAIERGSRVLFIIDGLHLMSQTAERFHASGIEYGLIGDGTYTGVSRQVVIAMVQTLIRRDETALADLLSQYQVVYIDECHVQYQRLLTALRTSATPTIGLTATPFAHGMGTHYDALVQVTTTSQLIAEQHLAPLRIRACTEIDMTGRPLIRGEWSSDDVRDATRPIVGDIPSTWIEETRRIYGSPVKTMMFSADIAHGEELCAAFLARGIDARQITAYDTAAYRERTMRAYIGGEFDIVCSVAALGKGIDIPDIQCIIIARPLARSFMTHLQMLGRGMRPSPGKDHCLVLDHAGNCVAFFDPTESFFTIGATHLDNGQYRGVARAKREHATATCRSCGSILTPGIPTCLACGTERRRARSEVPVPGTIVDIDIHGRRTITIESESGRPWEGTTLDLWRACCADANRYLRRHEDIARARRQAVAKYRSLTGAWPSRDLAYHPATRVPSAIRRRLDADYRAWRERQATQQRSIAS